MQLKEVLHGLGEFLGRKGIENAQIDAEWLVAHVLKCQRLSLYLNYFKEVAEDDLVILRKLAKRRALGEPLQYLLEEENFYGNPLRVDQRVLIPRPETEELVYQLTQIWQNATPPERILDLGTGSGAIAIALARLFPNIHVTAIDASKEALQVAQENASRSGVQGRICFIRSNWFSQVQGDFDYIVANPPYLSEKEWESAAREIRLFEPKRALVSAQEGLADLLTILKEARAFLRQSGVLVMETGVDQHATLHTQAKSFGYRKTQTTLDLAHKERFFWAWK